MNKTLLVTGAAGFIGSHVTQALLIRGDTVVGVDNLNDYYDPARKSANVAEMQLA
jgi:UDP-glucuronate 4-epimerase